MPIRAASRSKGPRVGSGAEPDGSGDRWGSGPPEPEPRSRSAEVGTITMSMADTPEPDPRFERFRLAYPSGTVVRAFYPVDHQADRSRARNERRFLPSELTRWLGDLFDKRCLHPS
jgi:hypothetical protein